MYVYSAFKQLDLRNFGQECAWLEKTAARASNVRGPMKWPMRWAIHRAEVKVEEKGSEGVVLVRV